MKTDRRNFGLNLKQQMLFRPLVKDAWLRQCLLNNWDTQGGKPDRKWYEDQLEELTGKRSTTDMQITPKGFDLLLGHFAVLAANEKMMEKACAGDEIRLRFQMQQCLAELTYLYNRAIEWDYAVATYAHMTNFTIPIEDCPRHYLWPIFFALDTHVRQLCDERMMTRKELRVAVSHLSALEAAYT
jgi:hypothetical protein